MHWHGWENNLNPKLKKVDARQKKYSRKMKFGLRTQGAHDYKGNFSSARTRHP